MRERQRHSVGRAGPYNSTTAPPHSRNPLSATSAGTGDMQRDRGVHPREGLETSFFFIVRIRKCVPPKRSYNGDYM